MALKRKWTAADTESAINKGNGNLLKDLVEGTPKSARDARKQYTSKGSSRGHEYLHRGPSNKLENPNAKGQKINNSHKSRYQSRHCAIGVTVEMLNSPDVQNALGDFDDGKGIDKEKWIKNIPISGDWYGYPPDDKNKYGELHKIKSADINMVTDGKGNLYIYSSFPRDFSGAFEVDLGDLFS